MSFLNISIPPFEAFIRAEFLRNMEDSHGVKLPCMVFGMASVNSTTTSSSWAGEL
jgi:hypothetical protein